MTCIVERYNPQLSVDASSTYVPATTSLEYSPSVSVLRPHPPTQPVSLTRLPANSVPVFSEVQVPSVQQSVEVVELPSDVEELVLKQQVPTAPAWWESELAPPIHRTLREREKAIAPIQFRSPQLEQRKYLVDFLFTVSENLLLSHGTRFLAVKLMDHFMDKHIVMDYRMKLVALTSLLVAAKFEDTEERIPSIQRLQHFTQLGHPDYYTREEFHKMELYLLKFFNWSVSYPSSAHFADYYLTPACSIDDTRDSQNMPEDMSDPLTTTLQMEKFNCFCLEASLREYTFLQYLPSMVAAAAVCTSRICLGFPTAWNNKLESITDYSLEELVPIVDRMLRLFENPTS